MLESRGHKILATKLSRMNTRAGYASGENRIPTPQERAEQERKELEAKKKETTNEDFVPDIEFIEEEITPEQLDTIKVFYSIVKSVDKTSPKWKNFIRSLSRMSKDQLKALKDVPFIGPEVSKMIHEDTQDNININEYWAAGASSQTHLGEFQEKEHGKWFTYKKTNDEWAKKHNLPHEIDVLDGKRYAHVKGTVAHVATDENEDGTPKLKKWNLKKHNKWVKEDIDLNEERSRAANIVRETWKAAKKKKQETEDVSGKVEKFEKEPILSDTIEKQ